MILSCVESFWRGLGSYQPFPHKSMEPFMAAVGSTAVAVTLLKVTFISEYSSLGRQNGIV